MIIGLSLYDGPLFDRSLRHPQLADSHKVRYYDLSRLTLNDRIYAGECAVVDVDFPSIVQYPMVVAKAAIKLHTLHSAYKSRGFLIDYYDNKNDQWARDVHYDDSSIYAPLTNEQIKKLSQVSLDVPTMDWDLEASIEDKTLVLEFKDEAIARLDAFWDLGKDEAAVKNFLDLALRSLEQSIFDDQNSYLNIYHKYGQAHTLREFHHQWPDKQGHPSTVH